MKVDLGVRVPPFPPTERDNMKINLEDKWITSLAEQPETSMGAQDVVVKMADGSEFDGLVLNCSLLFTVGEIDSQSIEDITVKGHNKSV